MAEVAKTAFDPGRYLTKVKGSDYLEVKWRLVWLRDQYPDARVETELVAHSGNHAIFKATVTIIKDGGQIGGIASGWGSEDINGFANYIEKAETKAVGRALAALGFGTQFADDFADGDGPIADGPVSRSNERQPTQIRSSQQQRPSGNSNLNAASESQVKAIYGISKGLGWSKDELLQWVADWFPGATPEMLTRADASTVIEELNKHKDAQR